MNLLVIKGNLTADPDLRYTPKGSAICELRLAINEGSGEDRETLFVNAQVWGNAAEVVSKHFKKGGEILLQGKLAMDSWTDKTTEQKRTKHFLKAWTFEFCNKNESGARAGGPPEGDKSRGDTRPPREYPEGRTRPPAKPPVDPDADAENDIPF